MKGSIYKSVSNSGRTSWRYQIDAGHDELGSGSGSVNRASVSRGKLRTRCGTRYANFSTDR